jgi:hypothetical protein
MIVPMATRRLFILPVDNTDENVERKPAAKTDYSQSVFDEGGKDRERLLGNFTRNSGSSGHGQSAKSVRRVACPRRDSYRNANGRAKQTKRKPKIQMAVKIINCPLCTIAQKICFVRNQNSASQGFVLRQAGF